MAPITINNKLHFKNFKYAFAEVVMQLWTIYLFSHLFIHQHQPWVLEIISEDVSHRSLWFSSCSPPICSCVCVSSSRLCSDSICQRHASLWFYSTTLQGLQHPSTHSLLSWWQREKKTQWQGFPGKTSLLRYKTRGSANAQEYAHCSP